MSSPPDNSSGMSQLQALVDLLIDLQVPTPNQEASEKSLPSNLDSTNQSQASGSDSFQECQDDHVSATAFGETESKQLNELQLEVEQPKPHSQEAIVLAEDLVPTAVEDSPSQLTTFEQQEHLPEQERPLSILQEQDGNQAKDLATPPEAPNQQLIPPEQQLVLEQVNSEPPKQESRETLEQGTTEADTAQNKFDGLLEDSTSDSIVSTDEAQVDEDDSGAALESLRYLLLTPELLNSRQLLVQLREKLDNLDDQLHQRHKLISLLLPLMSELLQLKISEAKEELAQVIAPIVDEAIEAKAKQDKLGISCALAPVLPDAIAVRVKSDPGEFAKALGPEMGTAIKEQINLERDVMVDALYPIIGSTIAKYMADIIDAINQKVEQTLSLEGVSRKIRAQLQGVSEAELILKEAMPFAVQGIFLIQKGSGLVIAEVQPDDGHRLESEMVAGMLTAIRSFVNDWISQSGEVSELDQIEYGNSQITLEVAGYCYLAVVTKGKPPQSFIQEIRNRLGTLVQRYGVAIESFDGNPEHIPEEVHQPLKSLTKISEILNEPKKRKFPVGLMITTLTLVSTIFISFGIYQYRSRVNSRLEKETSLALSSDPELAVYRLQVGVEQGTLKLSGNLPSEYLRSRAEAIAQEVQPNMKLENKIIAVKIPPDPELTAAEVKRVTEILNQIDGIAISADYSEGKVTVQGTIIQLEDAQKITQAFAQIPGVDLVSNTETLSPNAIVSRIYFDLGSAQLKPTSRPKVIQLKTFLEQYPNKHLRLLGHSDRLGRSQENQELALERAKTVKNALVNQGIEPTRLQVAGTTTSPAGIDDKQPLWLSRCVEFEVINKSFLK
ncbi:MAG: OmpA family protein [Symploca sp. SIO2E9]|nr:OmpA family protein [Symploca sp. SIO2E9]